MLGHITPGPRLFIFQSGQLKLWGKGGVVNLQLWINDCWTVAYMVYCDNIRILFMNTHVVILHNIIRYALNYAFDGGLCVNEYKVSMIIIIMDIGV